MKKKDFPLSVSPDALAGLPASASLTEASAEDLRVLVCLLAGASDDPGELSRAAGCSVARAKSALSYWEGCGVICGEMTAANTLPEAAEATPFAPDADTPATDEKDKPKPLASARELYPRSESENAAYIKKNGLAGLINECQRLFGRLFNPSEVAVVVGLDEQLGLDKSFILTLANWCASRKKANVRYLEKMAIGLFDDGIDTPEELDCHLRRMERISTFEGQLRKLLGCGDRKLTAREQECFGRWICDYEYGMDVIGLAYDITVDAKNKVSVPYMDKILQRWYGAGCRDLPSVEALITREKAAKTKKPGKPAPPSADCGSFDTDDFFARALRRSYGEDVSDSLGIPKDKKNSDPH